MNKRSKCSGAVLVAVLLGLTAVAVARGGEPKYHGRPLSSWLQQYSEASLEETQRLAEAETAIRAIGAPKALPRLLVLVKAKDDPVRTWIMEKEEKYRIRGLHWPPAIERQLEGIAGFEVLGTNCASAVGELTKLLEDKDLAFVAARCLENVGKPAEQALCRCLTNANWQVRHLSVSALAAVTDDVEVYVNRIKPRLGDVEPTVRCTTVQDLAIQNNAPELAVPLLISALEDSDDHVFAQAAEGLAGFGTNALGSLVTLTNLVGMGSDAKKVAALKALTILVPAEALPIVSNVVVNGSSRTMAAALQDLKSIAPELALKMTLFEFHSPDAQHRLVALNFGKTYDMLTPGIAEAFKNAASSDDPELARRAMAAMRQMVREERQKKTMVDIPNEPSFQGRSLGEWLSMRHDGWEFSTNALQALQAMGTDVIPALLARVAYRDPVFNLDDYDVSMSGATALIALREQAKPALPALVALMDSDNGDLALRAMIATLGTGTDAMPCLIKGLTNRFPNVRSEAASFLTQFGGKYPQERNKALPFIVKLLSDADINVRVNATNALKEIDAPTTARPGVK